MDCFASLAMTAPIFKHERAFSQREAPELCKKISALRNQRAQGMPGAQCARSLVCKKTSTRASHHGHTGNHPAFPAQWFYGFLRALPGDQALLTPSPALLLADLTPALGRQNHTTLPSAKSAVVLSAARVHRIPPRVRDVRTPLCWDGMIRSIPVSTPPSSEILKFRNWKGVPVHIFWPSIACREKLERKPINSEWSADVRFCAHNGLKSDIAPCPFCATTGLVQRSKLL